MEHLDLSEVKSEKNMDKLKMNSASYDLNITHNFSLIGCHFTILPFALAVLLGCEGFYIAEGLTCCQGVWEETLGPWLIASIQLLFLS